MRNEAYNCDCIEYMRTLPDKHFSLAVCDPPFGNANDDSLIGGGGGRFHKGGWFERYHKVGQTQRGTERTLLYPPPYRNAAAEIQQVRRQIQEILPSDGTGSTEAAGQRDTNYPVGGGKLEAPTWDVAPPQEFFDELFRVSKNQIIWGGNYFALPPTRCFLVWKKTNIPQDFSMAMCEYAWTSFFGNAKVFEYTSLRNDHSGKFHPTEKPQALYAWIYRNYLEAGGSVFDPMMGSQASRIAAAKMGIDYVGCEIDEYYYMKGCEFFDREINGIRNTPDGHTVIQQDLFGQ